MNIANTMTKYLLGIKPQSLSPKLEQKNKYSASFSVQPNSKCKIHSEFLHFCLDQGELKGLS